MTFTIGTRKFRTLTAAKKCASLVFETTGVVVGIETAPAPARRPRRKRTAWVPAPMPPAGTPYCGRPECDGSCERCLNWAHGV